MEFPKGAKSPFWAHFGFEIDKSGKRVDEKSVRCRLCNNKVNFSGNKTNLGQHLQIWHPDVSTGAGSSHSKSLQLTLGSFSGSRVKNIASDTKRAQEITKSIVEFVAKDMRPVALIEGTGFQSLVATLEPSYQIPSRKSIMKALHSTYDEVKTRLQTELNGVDSVALTTDHWTSPAVDSYVGLTAHFITQEWKLQTRVLQTKEVRERHTALNIDDLRAVIDEWDLSE